ncbi:hypothetical protein [Methanosarcina sp. WH1]|uniref:hypothetical protein n=1 Tax=Methanosarcina sp. WH1 TaxID=1434102 RepID=UPI000615CC50|nr:hypothetical protein [Methanosarcina sp. WH1]AKB22301.1 hypothetical protein MSWH1_2030 [Methanosarcina sp. WH1]
MKQDIGRLVRKGFHLYGNKIASRIKKLAFLEKLDLNLLIPWVCDPQRNAILGQGMGFDITHVDIFSATISRVS